MSKVRDFYVKKLKKRIKPVSRYCLLNLFILALVLNFVVEIFSRSSLTDSIIFTFTKPHLFLYGVLIIMLTLSPGLLLRRRYFWYLLFSILWLAGGITNCVILHLRVTPFTFTDIILVGDALRIWNLYLTKVQMFFIIIGVLLLIALIVACFFVMPKYNGVLRRLKNLGYCSAIFVVVYIVTYIYINTGIVKLSFANIAKAYKSYGFTYCFSGSLVNRGVRKPKGYSSKIINEIKAGFFDDDKNKKENSDIAVNSMLKPNVIFVQLESFFDPKRLETLEITEDPIPNFRYYYERFPHGYLSVPSFGAGTANTEVEIIIGMNMDDFGTGEYPYKTVFNRMTCESAAFAFKNLGYVSHAIHNNTAAFYSRNVVFANIGFDTFTTIEMMSGYEKTVTGWAKDDCLVDVINDALDSTPGSDYIYTISVQGHGQYPADYDPKLMPIDIKGFADSANTQSFRYYCNQIKEMDDFVKKLVDTVNARDEKSIIVFYGDHLPTFNLDDEDLSGGSIYQTQYVVWNNLGIVALNEDLEAYQLTAYVMNLAKIHEGTLFKYHQSSADSPDYLENLKQLEYDMIGGKRYVYDGESLFEATDIEYGIKKPKIKSVAVENYDVLVTGRRFNEFCIVSINGEECMTQYVSPQVLKVNARLLNDGDKIQVKVRNGKTLFYETEEVTYVQD